MASEDNAKPLLEHPAPDGDETETGKEGAGTRFSALFTLIVSL